MVALPDAPVFQALFALLVGLGVFALGFAAWHGREIRSLLGNRDVDVFSLSTGQSGAVSITGRARPAGETITAPFTGTECLAVEYAVEERRHRQNGTSWVTVDSGVAGRPFLLEDDTGSVLVEPDRVRLSLARSDRTWVDGGEAPPDQIQSFIDASEDVGSEQRSVDLKLLELEVGNDRRYDEHRLDPGAAVTVFGVAEARPGVSSEVGQVNAVLTAGAHPLVVSDTSAWRTLLRSYWVVLLSGVVGVASLAGAAVVLFL